jgi:hypothetical protein
MNVEIGTETPIFLFWEYFSILSLQCGAILSLILKVLYSEMDPAKIRLVR